MADFIPEWQAGADSAVDQKRGLAPRGSWPLSDPDPRCYERAEEERDRWGRQRTLSALAFSVGEGLAALACIITACPGTTWARYDSTANVLTMHILDLVDEQAWIETIKQRYERRLLEIFR